MRLQMSKVIERFTLAIIRQTLDHVRSAYLFGALQFTESFHHCIKSL